MAQHSASAAQWIGEMLAQSTEYAVIAITADGHISGWFGAAARLFGYSDQQVSGQSFDMLFSQADIDKGVPKVELELTRQSGRSEDDRWHVRQDGGRFWANGVLMRHVDQRGELVGYLKVLRDRTDIRIRDEASQNRVERLTHQLAEQRRTLGTLVHEVRNSMAPVLNASHVAASNADAEVKARMHAVIARQIEVIQRVLQAAGDPQPHRAEMLHVQPIVLQDALRIAVDALRSDASAKEQSLLLVLPEEPVTIEVDPPRLQQMVLNLLSNAVKYTPPGGHIAVSSNIEGDMAVIRVDDDGVGIAPENLERVFNLFTREGNQDAVPGFGIGLAVVERLAQLHGGFVQARSPGKGKGSQFALQLPLRQAGAHRLDGSPR